MRTNSFAVLLAGALLVALVSCGGGDSPTDPGGGGTPSGDWTTLLDATMATDWSDTNLLVFEGVQLASFSGGVLRTWTDVVSHGGTQSSVAGDLVLTSRQLDMTQYSDARLRFTLQVDPGRQRADVMVWLKSYVPATESLRVLQWESQGYEEGAFDISLVNGLDIAEGALEVSLGNYGPIGSWAEIRNLQLVVKD